MLASSRELIIERILYLINKFHLKEQLITYCISKESVIFVHRYNKGKIAILTLTGKA